MSFSKSVCQITVVKAPTSIKLNKTALELEDIFGDEDIELTRRQIRETLNSSVEEEIPAELPLVTEDVAEEEIIAEAIAADFME